MARSFKTLVLALAVYAVCFNILTATAHKAEGGLWEGFYTKSCPKAESIVHDAVKSAVDNDPGLAGGLLRLLFHDCFIRGCDASVLIDSTDGNQAEKDGVPNAGSIRGLEVLDAAKTQIEAACPGTVSCADIIAIAARDSVALSGGPWYSVAAGRRDGRVSLASEASNLPGPSLNAQQLIDSFSSKGLSQDDMVALSGAHTIGQARCSVVQSTTLSTQDPNLDQSFAAELQAECPAGGDGNTRIFMDSDSGKSFDNEYYKNLVARKGLFPSDQTLYDDADTRDTVASYSKDSDLFASKFVKAMGKMGAIEVLTGDEGEIRLNCRRIN